MPCVSLYVPFQAEVRCARRALQASPCALLSCLVRQSSSVILNTLLLLLSRRTSPTPKKPVSDRDCAMTRPGLLAGAGWAPHPLVLLLGFAEQLQDVDGPRLCDTVGPLWFHSLRRASLGEFCFLLHDPRGTVSERLLFNTHSRTCEICNFNEGLLLKKHLC